MAAHSFPRNVQGFVNVRPTAMSLTDSLWRRVRWGPGCKPGTRLSTQGGFRALAVQIGDQAFYEALQPVLSSFNCLRPLAPG